MLIDKLAQIMNTLAPPYQAKGTPSAPSPRPKTPSSPGLGAKMREETSRSLESMLKKGSYDALVHFGLKLAQGLPTAARPPATWGDMHHGVQQAHASSVSAKPAALPAPASAVQPLPGAPVPPPAAAGPTGTQRFMRGGMKTLGLAGVGALAAGGYAMHQQNEHDRQQNGLVYSPMSGSMMQ